MELAVAKVLEKVFEIRDTEMYYISREDGQALGVTTDKSKILQILQDENPDCEVVIKNVKYNDNNYTYDIEVDVTEDGDEEIYAYDYLLGSITKY